MTAYPHRIVLTDEGGDPITEGRLVRLSDAMARLLRRIDEHGGIHPGPADGNTGAGLERRRLVRWQFTGGIYGGRRLVLTELGRQAIKALR